MTYWFTVAKTGQRKPFQQICICSKTMHQISLKIDYRLVMVFMSMVPNTFIIQATAKNILLNATSRDTSAEHAKKTL